MSSLTVVFLSYIRVEGNRKYHLEGTVVACTPLQFKKMAEEIVPILIAKKDAPCIMIPKGRIYTQRKDRSLEDAS